MSANDEAMIALTASANRHNDALAAERAARVDTAARHLVATGYAVMYALAASDARMARAARTTRPSAANARSAAADARVAGLRDAAAFLLGLHSVDVTDAIEQATGMIRGDDTAISSDAFTAARRRAADLGHHRVL